MDDFDRLALGWDQLISVHPGVGETETHILDPPSGKMTKPQKTVQSSYFGSTSREVDFGQVVRELLPGTADPSFHISDSSSVQKFQKSARIQLDKYDVPRKDLG